MFEPELGDPAMITDFESIRDVTVLFDLKNLLRPSADIPEGDTDKKIVKVCRMMVDLCSQSKYRSRLDE